LNDAVREEGTDNFILVLVERSYFTTRASRRYHGFSGTCSGVEIGHLSSSPLSVITPDGFSLRGRFPGAQ